MRFDCNKGYSRLGERYAECQNGRWSIYTFPICISKDNQTSVFHNLSALSHATRIQLNSSNRDRMSANHDAR